MCVATNSAPCDDGEAPVFLRSPRASAMRGASSPRMPAPAAAAMSAKWRMAVAACVVHALHMATMYLAPSTLMSPMRASLGLTVAQIALPLTVLRLTNAVFLLPAGLILDRFGAARALWPAIALSALAGLAAPLVRSLPELIALQLVFAASQLFAGLTAMFIVINAAFDAGTAGTAASIVLSGYSMAGTFVPALVGALAHRFGWRTALAAINAFYAAVGVLLAHRFLRRPVGYSADHGRRKRLLVVAGGVTSEPLLSRRYAAVLVMMAALSLAIHIVGDHLIVFMREDMGLSFQRCTMYMSLYNFVAMIAKLVGGRLSDRYSRSVLFAIFGGLGAFSCSFLVSVSSSGSIVLASTEIAILYFVVLYGFGYSSVFTLILTSLPEFGKERMGLRSNLNLMFLFTFGSFGSFAAGSLRTSTGSYAQSFLLNAMCWVVILGCIAVYASEDKSSRQVNAKKASEIRA